MNETVDVDLYIHALREQRDHAMDATAKAVARNAQLRQELEQAQRRIAELEQQAQRS